MENWPLSTDFSRMLQNPKFAFRDPALKQCVVEMNAMGQPKARSGNFATVYRGYRIDGTEFAIRTFNRRADERRERYRLVHEYLSTHPVSSIVDFHYDEQGIRSASDGQLYPLLTMEWVSGVTLFEWTRDRCREGYHEALAIGAQVWLQLVQELTAKGVVHGDLQHGNVLVDQRGRFRLVDYDCMAVPELMSRRNLEMGMLPYQHPARAVDTPLFLGLDNYSALVVYVALRALAVEPALWITYVDASEYDRMLFRSDDFENPAASPLYQSLMNSPDQQVRDLTHYLFELYRYDLNSLPPVEEVLLWCHSLESLLAERDWDKVVLLVGRMGPEEQVPPDLQPQVDLAHRRVAARMALEAALEAGDEQEVQRCYVPELLDDYPAAADSVQQAQRAEQVIGVLEVLKAAKRLNGWDVFRDTWRGNQDLLARRASARPFKEEMQRLLTGDNLRKMLADPDSDDETAIETWRHLSGLGGHPSADPLKPLVEHRIARRRALLHYEKLLRNAPEPADSQSDRELVEAWPGEVLGDWKQAQRAKAAYESAARRLAGIDRLKELVTQCTLDSEKQIAKMAVDMPGTYRPGLEDRFHKARQRLRGYRDLSAALQQPASDVKMAAAWRVIADAKGEPLVSAKVRNRIRLAEKRAPLLECLAQIGDDLPLHEADAQILTVWNEKLLDGCHDAAAFAEKYRLAAKRREAVERLRQALADFDLKNVEAALADPRMVEGAVPPDLARSVQEVRRQLAQQREADGRALQNALSANQRGRFYELFDTGLLRQICRESPRHQATVTQWTESEILPLASIGLTADAEEALAAGEENGYRLKWNWPEERFSDRCRVAVCAEPPKPFDPPDEIEKLYDAVVTREQWEANEDHHAVAAEPEWMGGHVVVWAVVDLGFMAFHSEPLVLGRLEPPSQRKRWGLFR